MRLLESFYRALGGGAEVPGNKALGVELRHCGKELLETGNLIPARSPAERSSEGVRRLP